MKKITYFSGVGVLLLFFLAPAMAGAMPPPDLPGLDVPSGSQFREYIRVTASAIPIKVPTVIEVPLDGQTFEYPFFEVEETTGTHLRFIGSYFHRSVSVSKTVMSIANPDTVSWSGTWSRMLDGDYRTYASFAVPENGAGRVVIELASQKQVAASSLSVLIDSQVALPNTILIQADTVDGVDSVVLNTTKMLENTMGFPKTVSSHWKITFTYSQPLRITELQINDEDALRTTTQGLRFLALPERNYRVYINSDRAIGYPWDKTTESGDLVTDKGVVRIASITPTPNPEYVVADTDFDGVPDIQDNCVSLSNASQVDVNQSGAGDACEDFDRDQIINEKDNCPSNPNVAQTDTDGDNIGDVCDKEESRITERMKWLPWAGMGIALLVVVGLSFLTLRGGKSVKPDDPTSPPVG